MKNPTVYLTATALTLAALTMGCADTETIEEQPRLTQTEQIIQNLELAGYPESDIGVTADGVVFVGNDAVVTLQASREMAGIVDDSVFNEGFRQYRTTNTIDTTQVQTICINTLSGAADFDAQADMDTRAALDLAIANYNDMNLQFSMVRDGGSCDATIDAKLDNSGGGIAGFPAGGMPYNEFTIGGSLASNYGTLVAAHVMTHELGHCVGFRHTDYYDRTISCGGAGGPGNDEGDGGVGALHIPGTPDTAVLNGSVMNACYNQGSTGEWTLGDEVALDCLYRSGSCAPPPPPDYTNRESLAGLSGSRRSETHYGPFDATGFDAVRFQMTGGSGDADLHVRLGAPPTASVFDCRPYGAGSEESCEFNPSDDGLYYVMIRGYSAYSDLTLNFDAAGVGGGGGTTGGDSGGDGGGGVCGDAVCDPGESCDGRNGTESCASDCEGVTGGKPSARYCYVGDACEGPGCP